MCGISKKFLDWCQGKVDKSYEKNGLTDFVLETQIAINKIRHYRDINDKKNIITDDGYVQ